MSAVRGEVGRNIAERVYNQAKEFGIKDHRTELVKGSK